ncbi:transporter, major facilitator family [Synechococcus sp. PCC 7335]|uniref:BCD family MFS transporter n=1 Tax=Synechococcus sp. (strain ATCC 29403 / PCC 7335) TaxID=91464 RepID=UPI00017EB7E9|nr:BCD family MFS transporter [Synechococcus sp. PCC 7335]EDX86807.1 transporter, major facilitator family [Synechococcus sp. PCC 7335]
MAGNEIPLSQVPKQPERPQIGLFSMLRLGLFNMGLGIMSLLTLGVLNRVMIDELRVPALVTAGVISVYQFMAPARVWFGQLSDTKPVLGHHRSGYIWLGIGGMALSGFVAVQVMWQLGEHVADFGWSVSAYPWAGLLAAVFALYGLALSATTPFTALLVDVSDEKTKSKIVGIGWSMLMLGIVAGVIIINIVLGAVDNASTIAELKGPINRLFVVVPAIVFVITLVSTAGIENRFSQRSQRSMASERDDSITFGQALKILSASRQTGLFFCFLLVLSLSLFTQNPVLEPYGSQIFGMTIQQTTAINAFFGIGTLIGIISTGFVLMPMLGKKRTVKLGCAVASVFLIGLIVVGLGANPMALNVAVGLFGLASGVLTTGSIVLMLDLTAAETAGTFIGAWGLAQATAQGGASLLGGGLLSLGKVLTGASAVTDPSSAQLLPAYGLVFATQAVGMWIAIALVSRVDIVEFQLDAKKAISAALENDLD